MKKFKEIVSRNRTLAESMETDNDSVVSVTMPSDSAKLVRHAISRHYDTVWSLTHPVTQTKISAVYSQLKNHDENPNPNTVATITVPKDSAKLLSHILVRHYDTILRKDPNHPSLDKLDAVMGQLDGTKESKTSVNEWFGYPSDAYVAHIQKKIQGVDFQQPEYNDLNNHLNWYAGTSDAFKARINNLFKQSPALAMMLAHTAHAGESDKKVDG